MNDCSLMDDFENIYDCLYGKKDLFGVELQCDAVKILIFHIVDVKLHILSIK